MASIHATSSCTRLALLCTLFISTSLYAQKEPKFPIELENGQTFYPGEYVLNSEESHSVFLNFDRERQRLVVMDENDFLEYSASEIASFRFIFQSGTPFAEEVRYITWRYQRDWPSYEQMAFFRVLADYRNCAIVSSDRKPQIRDQYPDSTEVYRAKIYQGIKYHIILPNGDVVGYERETIDGHLQTILNGAYADVMMYAHEHGLSATRFYDLFEILDYAETRRYGQE